MFTSYRELRRLRKALEQATRENKEERIRHFAREDELLDRCLTGAGKYALRERSVPEAAVAALAKIPASPDPFAEWGEAEREFDIKCFREAGHPDPEQAAKDAYIQNYVLTRQP